MASRVGSDWSNGRNENNFDDQKACFNHLQIAGSNIDIILI